MRCEKLHHCFEDAGRAVRRGILLGASRKECCPADNPLDNLVRPLLDFSSPELFSVNLCAFKAQSWWFFVPTALESNAMDEAFEGHTSFPAL